MKEKRIKAKQKSKDRQFYLSRSVFSLDNDDDDDDDDDQNGRTRGYIPSDC